MDYIGKFHKKSVITPEILLKIIQRLLQKLFQGFHEKIHSNLETLQLDFMKSYRDSSDFILRIPSEIPREILKVVSPRTLPKNLA